MDAEITTNSSRQTVCRICLSQHNTTSFHCIEALPDHGDHRATSHVLDKSRKERLLGKISVVLLQVLYASLKVIENQLLISTKVISFKDNKILMRIRSFVYGSRAFQISSGPKARYLTVPVPRYRSKALLAEILVKLSFTP